MNGTSVGMVKKFWFAVVDKRVDERLDVRMEGMEDRLDARMTRMEEKLDATRELRRGLETTRVEVKQDMHRMESRLSAQIERLGERFAAAAS